MYFGQSCSVPLTQLRISSLDKGFLAWFHFCSGDCLGSFCCRGCYTCCICCLGGDCLRSSSCCWRGCYFVCCLSSCCSCLGIFCLVFSCCCRRSYYWRGCCFVCWLSSSCSCCLGGVCLGSFSGCCWCSCCVVLLICCCWAFSCWHWVAAPPSYVVPLLPVAASGLGCLVMGGIMIPSFGHWILWTRASTRVATSPPSIGTGIGYWLALAHT
jgi:hypothetical protein